MPIRRLKALRYTGGMKGNIYYFLSILINNYDEQTQRKNLISFTLEMKKICRAIAVKYPKKSDYWIDKAIEAMATNSCVKIPAPVPQVETCLTFNGLWTSTDRNWALFDETWNPLINATITLLTNCV